MTDFDELAGILDCLCPMHILLDETGHIRRVGPTLQKLRADPPMAGQRFLELFELGRPRSITTMAGLMALSGAKLHLSFREGPRTSFKGVIVPAPGGAGAIVNLSFGISVLDAVRDYALTSADFSATDLTIELLYLVEAKSAAMEASRKLNLRLQGAMIAAEEQAFTDTLTGLKNRRAMDHVLARMMRSGTPFALLHLDLDHFKEVNDTLGHAAGDHVLQEAARIMVAETRDADTVARVGGDEFVLILDRVQDSRRVGRIANRLVERLQAPMSFAGQVCQVSASIGSVQTSRRNATEPPMLLHMADLALYAAKDAGRGCHQFYTPEMAENCDTAVQLATAGPAAPDTAADADKAARSN